MNRLYQLRTATKPKISREKLAKMVGCSAGYINQLERGLCTNPNAKLALALERVLGLPVSYWSQNQDASN
jgi:transcriptional regulator with XRE-family HTH domain